MSNLPRDSSIQIAIAWCLAWGNQPTPQYPIEKFRGWRSAIAQGTLPTEPEWQQAFQQAETLTQLGKNSSTLSIPEITEFIAQHSTLWKSHIGLVYGGVTKVKSYVFESADLQEIRGASALLDRINLVDLPALFGTESNHTEVDQVTDNTPLLLEALIPNLIVYATGGKILAFCPSAFVSQLCNAIEKQYTQETLTANSCAVGEAFRPVEIYLGLLNETIESTLWHDAIATQYKNNEALQAYFGFDRNTSSDDIRKAFYKRKNFSELVGKLTDQFNQRRSGCDILQVKKDTSRETDTDLPRPSRRFPPMFETHPYLGRDDSDIRSAVVKVSADYLPDEPKLSEPTARKRRVGQIVKRESSENQKWYEESGFQALWNPIPAGKDEFVFQSWVGKFERYLKREHRIDKYDTGRHLFNSEDNIKSSCRDKREARSLHEIGASSNGYVGYIYADGNSMGQYIRDVINTPEAYQAFSRDIFKATEDSVYAAIADHLHPYYYTPAGKSSRQPNKAEKDPVWIHPFEIITIGGDDVLLVVPANKAMEVAQAIGKHFEEILLNPKHDRKYEIPTEIDISEQAKAHRYLPELAPLSKCRLSTSSGILITAANTPIYYADQLVSQLLKSAKQHLKTLQDPKKGINYYGGTVDFLVLKAVTMISSNVTDFRKSGLTITPQNRKHTLKLYGAPYTLHELKGLVKTVKAIKSSEFPKSQLYQIRSLLERGKRTAILNYRYFRVRLAKEKRELLETQFEQAWCRAGTNEGNLAPWLTAKRHDSEDESDEVKNTIYETIWRELVELDPFIDFADADKFNDEIQSQPSSNRRNA